MEYIVNYKGYEFNITQNEDGSFNIPLEVKEIETLGTALKPANEPICVARKPLSEKSVAENVLKWGTGGINIDVCRVGTELISHGTSKMDIRGKLGDFHTRPRIEVEDHITEGRFPANIILDEIAGEMLDAQSGVSKSNCKSGVVEGKEGSVLYHNHHDDKKKGAHKNKMMVGDYSDKGGASRFFYQAKVSKTERNMSGKSTHPTMKPIQLMSYLCKLVTPPNGIVLDPFSGSGSTGIAALLNDFRFVGMELEQEYFDIMEKRVNDYESYRKFLKK